MILFFTATLLVSIVGIVGLLCAKRYELQTGIVLLSDVRPEFERYSKRVLFWIEEVLPALVRYYSTQGGKVVGEYVRVSIAKAILWTEHTLERSLHTLRRTTDAAQPRPAGKASDFLREVAEHKKKLQHGRRSKANVQ